jgi:16S rRNA (guanine527-N7)-methyltransferase
VSTAPETGGLPASARARVAELVTQWDLPPATTTQFGDLLLLLARDPHAPTTVRDPTTAVDAHVADSLTGLLIPELSSAGTIADVGAGAGVPGLALAIARPDARVALVESSSRKCEFLERAVEVASVGNAIVVQARVEEWRPDASCAAVTARAVAPLAVLVEYAAPLLQEGGVLVAWKGRRDADEEAAGARAAVIVGLEPEPPIALPPAPGADHRHLHLFRKVADTPARFPRRAGVARKRPLA